MRYEAGKEVTFVPRSSAASKCIQMSLGRHVYIQHVSREPDGSRECLKYLSIIPYLSKDVGCSEMYAKIRVSLNCGCPQPVDTCGQLSKPYKLRVWNANLS